MLWTKTVGRGSVTSQPIRIRYWASWCQQSSNSLFLCFSLSLQSRRGEQQELLYLDESRVMLKYLLPLSEVIVDFYDELKTQSSGYARFVLDCE